MTFHREHGRAAQPAAGVPEFHALPVGAAARLRSRCRCRRSRSAGRSTRSRGDPLDLGLIGLSQFLPFVLLVLPAGHVADRHNRALILSLCIALEFFCALALLAFTLSGLAVAWPVFAVMVVFGVARAFSMPAGQAIMPNLVPQCAVLARGRGELEHLAGLDDRGPRDRRTRLPRRARTSSTARSRGCSPPRSLLIVGVKTEKPARPATPDTWHTLLEGLRFVWRKKVILGAVSLDLFAVLFGGAVALLPAYASDILHVGPDGFGWLRAAPGIGAADRRDDARLAPDHAPRRREDVRGRRRLRRRDRRVRAVARLPACRSRRSSSSAPRTW